MTKRSDGKDEARARWWVQQGFHRRRPAEEAVLWYDPERECYVISMPSGEEFTGGSFDDVVDSAMEVFPLITEAQAS